MQEEFESYKEEMSETADTIELLTLDKEMAEEKVRVHFTKITHTHLTS